MTELVLVCYVMAATPVWARAWRSYEVIRNRQLSPEAFRRITAVALWVMVVIIVSGAAVRLTGSGLGCLDWPSCTATEVVAPTGFHPLVEQANRLINAGIGIVAVVAVIGALARSRRRRDLIWLSVGLVGGVAAEIVLGGILVLEKLAPQLVSAHFLLGLAFLADALILHHRAGLADEDIAHAPRLMVSTGQRLLARLLLVTVAAVVCLGTVVTSTGPHGGSPQAHRFNFSLHTVAQIHGLSVEIFVALIVVMCWWLARAGVPKAVLRRAEILLVVVIAQGVVGYVQYATGVPAGLVEVHVTGSVAVVIAILQFHLGLTTRAPLPTVAEEGGRAVPVADPAPLAIGS